MGPIVTRLVYYRLAVKLLDNRLYILPNSLLPTNHIKIKNVWDFFYSVEEFYIPARRIWIPSAPLSMLDERFDLSKKIVSWKWGNSSETYSYDQVRASQQTFHMCSGILGPIYAYQINLNTHKLRGR